MIRVRYLLPVPLMSALVAALGLEAALAIARRFSEGTPTPVDNAIVTSLGYASLVGALVSPVKTTQLGVLGLEAAGTLAVKAAKVGKRKASKYNKEFAKQYKKIKSAATLKNGKLRKGITNKQLLKRAHAATKKVMK